MHDRFFANQIVSSGDTGDCLSERIDIGLLSKQDLGHAGGVAAVDNNIVFAIGEPSEISVEHELVAHPGLVDVLLLIRKEING